MTPWAKACQAFLSFIIFREFAQTHVHGVDDTIPPFHPPSSPSHSLLLPSIFPSITVFSKESALCIKWTKYWSFSFNISLFSEYSGLISFRIDWFYLALQETLESSPTPQFESINSSGISLLYRPILTSIHDYQKNHSFD